MPRKPQHRWDYLLDPAVRSRLSFTRERDATARASAHAKLPRQNRVILFCPRCGLKCKGYGGLASHSRKHR